MRPDYKYIGQACVETVWRGDRYERDQWLSVVLQDSDRERRKVQKSVLRALNFPEDVKGGVGSVQRFRQG